MWRPLKGDTEYFDVVPGDEHITEAAWSYVDMVAGHELLELIAFDPTKTTTANNDSAKPVDHFRCEAVPAAADS